MALTLGLAALAGAAARADAPAPPPRLADTGLYSDFAARTIDPRNLPYSPQYPLWADGGGKRRWIRLPEGSAVDARDPDRWEFPVGTRFWKEFAWSRRVETRYLERTRAGWIYGAYVWRDDESDAVLAPSSGLLTQVEVAPGKRHAIPSIADCKICHQGGRGEILGFSALQLSPDRDPLAPHAEPAPDTRSTLPALVRSGLIRGLPRELLERPPRIAAPSPLGRAALGYLHANCGGCHDAEGPLAPLGLALRHPVAARARAGAEPALAAVGHESLSQAPGAPAGTSAWISPGQPTRSTVWTRMASREPATQMPPLGTKLVDQDALALLRRWIEQDLSRAPELRRP